MNIAYIFENLIQKRELPIEVAKKVEAFTRHEAIVLFENAKKRLKDINKWHEVCENEEPNFQIMDPEGNILQTNSPEIGNLIRIKRSSPGETNGYDWVRIEEFETEKNLLKDREVFGFRVRPVSSPLHLNHTIHHFYTSESAITFFIIRKGRVVTAMEIEKNETAHTDASPLFNRLRKVVLACATMIGFSKPQWKSLVNGVLKSVN